MTRLYLKILALTGTAFFISVIVILVLLSSVEQAFFRPRFAEEMKAFAAQLESRLAGKSAEEAREELATLRERAVFRFKIIDLDRGGALPDRAGTTPVYYFQPGGAGYTISLEPDEALMAAFAERQGGTLFVALAIAGTVFALAALLVVLPLLRRLRAQEATISSIAEGDFDARAPVGTRDALGRLGLRINEMADKIQSLLTAQRDLLQAVSHEMRTPVSRVGFGLALLEGAKDADERRSRATAIRADLDEMDALLDELLTYLRFEEPGESTPVAAVDLGEVIRALEPKVTAGDPSIAVEMEVVGDPTVSGNARHLSRAVENVLRNAVHHARSRVSVTLTKTPAGFDGSNPAPPERRCPPAGGQGTPGFVEIRIVDDGEGVPETDRERIFEPFFRSDQSRNRQSGGSGLGLAIAARITEMHGGTIGVETASSGGAEFVFRLPGVRPLHRSPKRAASNHL